MSKIVILAGSPRQGGNSDLLAQAFAEGAALHHDVTTIRVADLDIHPCLGCNVCFQKEDNRCFRRDDMDLLYKQLADADVIAIASPVYFFGISAQLKAAIDRLHNPVRDSFKVKKTVLLLTAAGSKPELFDGILAQYRLILNFFHLEDGGTVLVRHAGAAGDVAGNPGLEEARKLGETL